MDYKKLFEDKKNGKIDDRMSIHFDNDGGYWACNTDSEQVSDEMCDEYQRRYGHPNGYFDLVDVMVAAGFNAEWV